MARSDVAIVRKFREMILGLAEMTSRSAQQPTSFATDTMVATLRNLLVAGAGRDVAFAFEACRVLSVPPCDDYGIDLRDFLAWDCIGVDQGPIRLTRLEVVRRWANQDSLAHTDLEIDRTLLNLHSLPWWIGPYHAAHNLLLCVARRVLLVGRRALLSCNEQDIGIDKATWPFCPDAAYGPVGILRAMDFSFAPPPKTPVV